MPGVECERQQKNAAQQALAGESQGDSRWHRYDSNNTIMSTKRKHEIVDMWRKFAIAVLAVHLAGCGLAIDNEEKLDRGEEALERGDYRAAIIDFKSVLIDEPENRRARLLLGQASVAVGDGASAEKELRRAVEFGTPVERVAVDLGKSLFLQQRYEALLSEDYGTAMGDESIRLELLTLKGNAHLKLDRSDEARRAFESVLASDAGHLEALLGLASSYMQDSRFAEAQAALDRLNSVHAEEPQAWILSASLNRQTGRLTAAERDYEKALSNLSADGMDNPDLQVQALVGLAEVLIEQSELERARAIVDDLAASYPGSLPSLMLGARIAYIDEDWSTTQELLLRVVAIAPDYQAARILLGATNLQLGNHSQAEMYLSAAIASDPNDIQARQLLAETRLAMRRADEAHATLEPLVSNPQADAVSLHMAARASLGRNDLDAAIDFLKRSVEKQPENVELKLQLAVPLVAAGRIEEAAAVLDGIEDTGSNDHLLRRDAAQVLMQLQGGETAAAVESARQLPGRWNGRIEAIQFAGGVEFLAGELDASRVTFERALAIDPDNTVAMRYLAWIAENQGDLRAAEAWYRDVLTRDDEALWAMLALSRLAQQSNDGENVVAWLERARSVAGEDPIPTIALVGRYLERGDLDSAERTIDEALAATDSDARLYNTQGILEYVRKDYQRSANAFEKAIEFDPGNVDYQFNLSRTRFRSGDAAGALQLLESADVDWSENLHSGVLYAAVLADTGDTTAAQSVLHRLQSRFPQSSSPFGLEAELLARKGDLSSAATMYDRALDIEVTRNSALRGYQIKEELGDETASASLTTYLRHEPDDQEIRFVLAESYRKKGSLAEAIAEYERVLRAEPENAIALNNLAWVYLLAGDERAADTAAKAFAINPLNSAIADTLGWILVETGSYEEGYRILEQAVELSGGRPEIRYHRAVALVRLDRTTEARTELQALISAGTEFASMDDARELLAQLD